MTPRPHARWSNRRSAPEAAAACRGRARRAASPSVPVSARRPRLDLSPAPDWQAMARCDRLVAECGGGARAARRTRALARYSPSPTVGRARHAAGRAARGLGIGTAALKRVAGGARPRWPRRPGGAARVRRARRPASGGAPRPPRRGEPRAPARARPRRAQRRHRRHHTAPTDRGRAGQPRAPARPARAAGARPWLSAPGRASATGASPIFRPWVLHALRPHRWPLEGPGGLTTSQGSVVRSRTGRGLWVRAKWPSSEAALLFR